MGPARKAGPLPVALANRSFEMLKIYLLPVTAGSIFPAPESTMPLAPSAGIGVATSGMTTGGRMTKYRHDGSETTTGPACRPVPKTD